MNVHDIPLLADLVESGYENAPPSSWPVHGGGDLDRTQFLTASEATFCPRLIWYGKQSNKSRLFGAWGFAERGHAIEAWVVQNLSYATFPEGYELCFTGAGQRSFVDRERRLSGTPDGVLFIYKDGQRYIVVVEFKSIDPRFNKANLPKGPHVVQTKINMHLVQKAFPEYPVIGSLLVYIDASNLQDIHEFTIEKTEDDVAATINAMTDKALSVLLAVTVNELKPEGMYRDECRTCQFKSRCSQDLSAVKQETAANDRANQGEVKDEIRNLAAQLFR